MPRKPDVPCADCGKLLYGGSTSLPAGKRRCRGCRKATPPRQREDFAIDCQQCGQPFHPWRNKATRFCSLSCASRHHQGESDPHRNQRKMSMRRARLRAAVVEDVEPAVVFDRDGWRCHMCNRRVTKSKPYPSPDYATLDHLVPLSLGGEHTYANLATACFQCNTRKGTRAVGEQLALIG